MYSSPTQSLGGAQAQPKPLQPSNPNQMQNLNPSAAPASAFGVPMGDISKIASGIGDMFGGGGDYSDIMNKGINSIKDYTDQATGKLDPYNQAGQNALGNYQKILSELGDDPAAFRNKIMEGYSASPEAQEKINSGMNTVKSQMAQMGLGGSGDEYQAMYDHAKKTINEDQNDYYNGITGLYGQALKGYGNIFGTGAQAAGQQGGYLANAGEDVASMQSAIAQAKSQEAAAKASAEANESSGDGAAMGALAGAAISLI